MRDNEIMFRPARTNLGIYLRRGAVGGRSGVPRFHQYSVRKKGIGGILSRLFAKWWFKMLIRTLKFSMNHVLPQNGMMISFLPVLNPLVS